MKGLTNNTGKCASLIFLPVKGKRSMKVITKVHRQWDSADIPSITFEYLPKYLVVNITPTEVVRFPRKKQEGYLQNIEKCSLIESNTKDSSNNTGDNS